jgi:hypothetical protein
VTDETVFFALLSLARNKLQIDIDYAIDEISLFQHVIERWMDRAALDEILGFGATLIEALELRYPRESQASKECLDSAGLSVTRPSRTSIGNPIWAKTNLLAVRHRWTGEDYNNTGKLRHSVSFTIRDGNHIHILEYATQESEAGVVVRYARTYEYVHGRPAHVRHRAWQVESKREQKHSDEFFAWLDMPSEDVYYCRFNLAPAEFNRDPPPLQIWKTDIAKQVNVTSIGIERPKPPRLAPSKRYWLRQNCFAEEHVHFDILPAALVAMGELAKANTRRMEGFVPPSARGTLLHWESARNASRYGIPRTMAETHPGYQELTRVVEEAMATRDAEL